MGSEHRDHPPGLHVEKEPYPPWRARMELLRRVHCSSVRRISGMQGQRNDSSQSKKKDQFIDQECALERTLMGCSDPSNPLTGFGASHQFLLGKLAMLPSLYTDNCVCKLNIDTGFMLTVSKDMLR